MSAHSTSGAYKATKLPPADLGTSMEDAHDPELRDDDSGPDEQIAGTPDNVVDISYMMAPGAGARERAQVLALLEPHEYDQIAKAQAKEIGCKVSTLTRYVQEEQRKLKQQKATDRPGWSVDPSTEAVNGPRSSIQSRLPSPST